MRHEKARLAVAHGFPEPGEFDATTGVAHAAASRFVIPHPSFGDANASAHARRSSASFLRLGDEPKKLHAIAEVKRGARRSSAGR